MELFKYIAMRVENIYREETRMSEIKKVRKKAEIPQDACVACGCCVKVCPMGAISIYKGIYAQVDSEKCVGCTKCAKECPASIITMEVR